MVSTKWTYHKEGSFTSNYFIFFWKFCFRLRTSSKELTWCTNHLNAHVRTFCKRWSFIWRYFFPVRSLMSQTETAISSYCGGGLQAEKFFLIFLYSRSSRAEVFLEHLWTAASYIPCFEIIYNLFLLLVFAQNKHPWLLFDFLCTGIPGSSGLSILILQIRQYAKLWSLSSDSM